MERPQGQWGPGPGSLQDGGLYPQQQQQQQQQGSSSSGSPQQACGPPVEGESGPPPSLASPEARPHPSPSVPPHMLTPGGFSALHYLKQPGVMLTSLGQGDGGPSLDAHQYASPGAPNMATGLPDIVQQSGKSGKGANSDLRLFKVREAKRQQSHLTQHLRIHANEKPYACVYCERTFRQRAILNQHLRIHSGEKPYQCPECGKHFRQKAILNQHEVASTFGDTDTQSGAFSPAPDANSIQYPAYFKDPKGGNHAVFGAGGAGSFGALQYIKQQGGSKSCLPDVIQHGRSAGMPLYVRCPICQKEFKQKSTLLQHGCIHIESRPYPCPECGKRFRQQSHLTQHLRIHTNEKPYGCVYCGRNFRQRTILNQHLRIHTGEKPYKCQQCGKDFRQKAILDQHTRTHQGDRPFCCPMPNCRRRFATEPEVKKHIDNHMNPHAAKVRRNSTSDSKPPGTPAGLGPVPVPRGLTPTVVKPELYFPQCYAPAFNHQPPVSTAQFPAQANGVSVAGEFKPPTGLPPQ
ncbi:hypothetical protein WN48_05163 [Eufriesea mexicana]|nr:hypothetical protein WN48_05163 [Eufriesea mexicana]